MTIVGSVLLIGFGFMVLLPFVFRRGGMRGEDSSSFAVGERDYGWFAILSGLTATFVGGAAILNLASLGYSYGWYSLSDVLPTSLGLLLCGLFLAPAIRGSGAFTVGTYLAQRGRWLKLTAGVLSTVIYTLVSAAQIVAITRLLAPHIPVPEAVIAAFAATGVASYILYAGYAAVTLTDRVQFLMILVLYFGALVVVLALTPYHKASAPVPQVAMPLDVMTLLALPLLFLPVSQDVHVRLQSAKSLRDAVLGAMLAGLAYCIFGLISVGLGILVARAGVTVASPDDVVPMFLESKFGGLAFVPMLAVLAAIVSTLDSSLFAASTSLAYDVWGPVVGSNRESGIGRPRLATLVLVIATVLISLSAPRILSLILPALVIYVAALLPLLLGIKLGLGDRPLAVMCLSVLAFVAVNEFFQWIVPFRAFLFAGIHGCLIVSYRVFFGAESSCDHKHPA